MVSAAVVLAASGAAWSVAQPATQDPQSRGPSTALETYVVSGAPLEADRRSSDNRSERGFEDAPIDIPQEAPQDFVPDAGSTSSADMAADAPYQPMRQKTRKALRDVDNQSGSEVDYGDGGARAPEQALAVDNQRRARAIDPAKRNTLSRLARVLGSLHALRVSCSGREDQTYRSRMSTLLDLEAPDASALRDPLVDAFNAGFQAYGQGSASCPSDRNAQEAKLAKDGFRLAKQMAASYRPVAGEPSATGKQAETKQAK